MADPKRAVKFLVGPELPELSPAAFARVNAARERCDALFANGDNVTAAVQLLDAQATEYLPLVVDENFLYLTLQILVATSLGIYGGEDFGRRGRVERELEERCRHWRAQWWDLDALRKESQSKDAPSKTRTPRKTKKKSSVRILEMYARMERPTPTPEIYFAIAQEVWPPQAAKAKPGSKAYKNMCDRVGAVIRRSAT